MKINKRLVFTNMGKPMGKPKGFPTPLPFHVMLMELETYLQYKNSIFSTVLLPGIYCRRIWVCVWASEASPVGHPLFRKHYAEQGAMGDISPIQ